MVVQREGGYIQLSSYDGLESSETGYDHDKLKAASQMSLRCLIEDVEARLICKKSRDAKKEASESRRLNVSVRLSAQGQIR